MATPNYFSDVTLLVTHYNRSRSMERLLHSFRNLNISFGDIVVSDDGSKPEHLDYLKSLQSSLNFRLITTEKNKGLGNNINKDKILKDIHLPKLLKVLKAVELDTTEP